MNQIQENLKTVQIKIEKVHRNANQSTKLIAVSKKQPLNKIQIMLKCGHRIYGENRVQEAAQKWKPLLNNYQDLELHLIGPLQTNKVKEAVELFNVIQTIDRPSLVTALGKEMKQQNKNLPCFIQVNTGEEPQKSGVLPHDLPNLLMHCHSENLNITGLMCIPPQAEPAALHFAFLKKLADEHRLKELSMGMSEDFEKAIPLGATYVRVGTALFGKRENTISV